MIIKTTKSEILADVDLIHIEKMESGLVGVFGTTPSRTKILLSTHETLEQAKRLVNNIYQLIPNALSLDPTDVVQNEVEIS
jgi:hypothetical protein